VRGWDAERVAAAAGARVVHDAVAGPARAVIDSRAVELDDLFVGLRGENDDGGRFAAGALEAGAWGVLVSPEWSGVPGGGAVLEAEDPLLALQSLARAWRRELGVPVIGITGSVGKTSTKELTAAMLAPRRHVHASRANFNTEIGLPLELLAAPAGTEVLVLELAMRGAGQIAELAAICEPDVGVITNIGPVHLEILGTIENIARAKAELLAGLREGGVAIVPDDEPLLDGLIPDGVDVVRFGSEPLPEGLSLPFTSAHMLRNARAALAAARAVGVEPSGRVEYVPPPLRGEVVDLPGGVRVLNDCYNANPLSMRAALADLQSLEGEGRRLAVLGDMLELGPSEVALHREIGAAAAAAGVDVLVTVGPLAAAMLEAFDGEGHAVADAGEAAVLAGELIGPGDVVLVKASRGVGLEVVAEELLRV
jgi:UDP-N-acetylmuramoyl-tripeptide--D-alanyl-D-alanine ligase